MSSRAAFNRWNDPPAPRRTLAVSCGQNARAFWPSAPVPCSARDSDWACTDAGSNTHRGNNSAQGFPSDLLIGGQKCVAGYPCLRQDGP